MSLDKLLFGWLSVVLIFIASVFVFWPNTGKSILKWSSNFVTSSKSTKPHNKSSKKKKIKITVEVEKAPTLTHTPTTPKKSHMNLASMQLISSAKKSKDSLLEWHHNIKTQIATEEKQLEKLLQSKLTWLGWN